MIPSKKVATRVRKVIAAILEEPKKFDMDSWHEGYYEGDTFCSTAHCFAGHLTEQAGCVVLNRNDVNVPAKLQKRYDLGGKGYTPLVAMKLLELVIYPYHLFILGHWPEPFKTQHAARKTPLAKAKVAARRYEHWLETGE